MGLQAALGQVGLVLAILGAGAAFTHYHVAHMVRPDHSTSTYMEDSKSGNGSRYRVITRGADTGGAYYTVEVLGRGSAPGFVEGYAASLPAHTHLLQDEELRVVRGALGYTRGGTLRDHGILRAGEKVAVPRGTPHAVFNAENTTDVLYEVTHRPAGPAGEAFFENLAGLGWSYGSLDRLHPLQVLVLYDAAATEFVDLPGFLQPVVRRVLVPVAKAIGFKAHYASHTSAGPAAAAEAAEEQPAATDDEQQQQGEEAHEEL